MKQKKNILIIYPDALTSMALGCYGNKKIRTPNIDRLAETGIKFDQCYVQNPLCMPSRACFQTGKYSMANRVRANDTRRVLEDDIHSMSKLFKDAGYLTAYYGKTHMIDQSPDGGWDDIYDLDRDYTKYLHSKNIKTPYREELPIEQLCAGISKHPYKDFGETILTNETINYLDSVSQEEKPFLLFYSPEAPHSPWAIPEEWGNEYNPDDMEIFGMNEKAFVNRPEIQNYLQTRADMASEEQVKYLMYIQHVLISILDNHVGKIIKKLEELKLRDNTLIIFSSDHGDYYSWQNQYGKCATLHDLLCHVPLIFNDSSIKGHEDKSLCESIDILPTLLNFAGINIPSVIQGRTIDLCNPENNKRKYVFAEDHSDKGGSFVMIRSTEYKLVYCPTDICQFYDLKEDPLEYYNQYENDKYAAIIHKMEKELLNWRINCIDNLPVINSDWIYDRFPKGNMY